jgi:hypothetical protein
VARRQDTEPTSSFSYWPDQLWDPQSLLYSWYWGVFPEGQRGIGVKWPLTSIEKAGYYIPTPSYIFMEWFLI